MTTNPIKPKDPTSKRTLIEDETEFRGKLSSRCPVVVEGLIEGEVSGPSLTVSAGGTVLGQVKVGTLKSEGTIGGEIEAETVQLAGSVKDQTVIRARSLEVRLAPKEGRLEVTFGECELAVGDVPSKEDSVPSTTEPKNGVEEPAPSAKGNRRLASTAGASVSAKAVDASSVGPVPATDASASSAAKDLEPEPTAAKRPARDAPARAPE